MRSGRHAVGSALPERYRRLRRERQHKAHRGAAVDAACGSRLMPEVMENIVTRERAQ